MNITQEFAKIKDKTNPLSAMLTDSKLRTAYNTQYRNSKRRGIEFNMSFEEWLTIWLYSGKLHLRGKNPGQFCMGRIGDKGAYEVGNVEIISIEQNTHDGHIGKKKKLSHRKKLKAHLATMRKRVEVSANGVVYHSMTDAAKAHNITVQCVDKRIQSNSASFINWKAGRVTRGETVTIYTNNVIQFPKLTAAEIDLSTELDMDDFTDDTMDYAALARGEV